MAEQHHQKQIDKVRSAEERRLFNDRMVQQEELEKLKDLSYKNVRSFLRSTTRWS